MPEQDPLAQLRDIHLPNAVSAWPPAPGWWLLAIVLIAALATVALYCYRHFKRNRYRRLADNALNSLQVLINQNDYQAYLQQLNMLLKQTALAANTKADVAGLTGNAWLEFLDKSAGTTDFTRGIGNVLQYGPYQPDAGTVDMTELHSLSQRWIKRHKIPC